jgi:hypothetical protein
MNVDSGLLSREEEESVGTFPKNCGTHHPIVARLPRWYRENFGAQRTRVQPRGPRRDDDTTRMARKQRVASAATQS